MAFMVTGALADLAASRGNSSTTAVSTLLLAHVGADEGCVSGLEEFWRYFRCRVTGERIDGMFNAETTMSVASLDARLGQTQRIVLLVRPESAGSPAMQGYARVLVRRKGAAGALVLPVGNSTEEETWAESGFLAELPHLVYRALDGARDWWVVTPGNPLPIRLFTWVELDRA